MDRKSTVPKVQNVIWKILFCVRQLQEGFYNLGPKFLYDRKGLIIYLTQGF